MTPAIQLFLLLTVGQNMMTWSDPAPDPLDELHVHLHLTDEDKEEKQIYNKYLLATKRPKMGSGNVDCDDGETNLGVDWWNDPRNYTCNHPERKLYPTSNHSTWECEALPKNYFPKHFCMNETIQYSEKIPTHGDHRPVWPKFGEYKFVPVQRWSHNIEHGAVVMLYHPCTDPSLVDKLKKIVKGCIRKHIITPYHGLTEKQPLALVAWGCRLLMSTVDFDIVVKFIQEKGLQGPEGHISKEGQYVHELQQLATPPEGSTMSDSVLCPSYKPPASLKAGQGDDYTSSGKGKEKADSQSQKAWPAPNSRGEQHGSKEVNGNNGDGKDENRWFWPIWRPTTTMWMPPGDK